MRESDCELCGRHFSYKPRDNQGRFCTRACFLANQRATRAWYPVEVNGYIAHFIDLVCINCGITYAASRITSKYCGASCQLQYEYANGSRDKTTIAKAAHEAVRKYGQPKSLGVKRGSPPQEVCDKISATKFERHKAHRQANGLPEPKLAQELRGSRQWREWRLAIFTRDKFSCVICGDAKGGNLEADHIKPRYLFPELTFDVSNGRTLCEPCHKKTSTYGSRVKLMTREDFL